MAQASCAILLRDVSGPWGKHIGGPSSSVHMLPAMAAAGPDTVPPSVAMQLAVLRHLLLNVDQRSETRVWFVRAAEAKVITASNY